MSFSVENNFGLVDFIVFTASLVLSVGIGIYFAFADRKKESTENYMYGNKKMSPLAIAISMAVTFVSAMSVISFPLESYLYGWVYYWGTFGMLIGIWFTANYYIPLFCHLKVNTVYEIMYMGISVYVPSLALSAVTPIPLEWSIGLTGIVCTVYTTIGGMKAVVWTDVAQGVIMLLGSLAVFVKIAVIKGGLGGIWEANVRGERNNFIKWGWDPRIRVTTPIVIVGFFLFSLQSSATSQPMVQRYISCRNIKLSKRSIYMKFGILAIIYTLVIANGLAMYAYFEGCDPLLDGTIEKADQMLPLMVVKIFKDLPGMAGLFVAAAYSGTLSTVSSGVNSIATVVLHDFALVVKPKISQKWQLIISKISSVIIGALVTLVAFLSVAAKGTILDLAFVAYGTIIGPSLAVYLYAFIPCINVKGAGTSLIVGLAVGLWMAIGTLSYGAENKVSQKLPLSVEMCGNSTEKWYTTTDVPLTTIADDDTTIDTRPALADTLYSLSPYLFGYFGVMVTIVVAIIVSLLTGRNKDKVSNPDLFIPLLSHPVFPPSVRKFFRFGVPEKATKVNGNHHEDYSMIKAENKDLI